ncbi:hypothetical protein [Roseomonas indoligenes]|uniref:Uncharacterized protein n=1 Tax=Roseomonas indoligenes TaxID=2820811 RepID=A0A940MQL7_9PROT|nr:hypothetical protein [Pararoseomonas indoligenes]MBP0492213.1 hypothetical protein [Pararoseomonas indoligenes]
MADETSGEAVGDAAAISAWIEHHTKPGEDNMRDPFCAPRIECVDGFRVSVQAGAYHYCLPREMCGPWTHFECGFPSAAVPEWLEWRDGPGPDTETVFGWVPATAIMDVIRQHGGAAALGALTMRGDAA